MSKGKVAPDVTTVLMLSVNKDTLTGCYNRQTDNDFTNSKLTYDSSNELEMYNSALKV